jgi:hypothetical protein
VTSSDDGKTWGNRQVVHQPAAGNANAPQVVNVGGTLMCSFQTNEDGSADANDVTVKVVTSGDGGATWGNELSVISAPTFWAGMLAMSDNSGALVMGDHTGVKAQLVTLG